MLDRLGLDLVPVDDVDVEAVGVQPTLGQSFHSRIDRSPTRYIDEYIRRRGPL